MMTCNKLGLFIHSLVNAVVILGHIQKAKMGSFHSLYYVPNCCTIFIEGFLHRLVEITQLIVVFTFSRHLTLINLDRDISNCKDSKMRDKHE